MDISIVIPFLNEEPNLKPLCDELKKALDPLAKDYEVLFMLVFVEILGKRPQWLLVLTTQRVTL